MLLWDPCGVCCIIVSYIALFYSDYVIIKWVILHTMVNSFWSVFHFLLFNIVLGFLCTSHIKAVFTDPGTVPFYQEGTDAFYPINCQKLGGDGEGNWTICSRCEIYRPPKAHHCHICQRCIKQMDHHCPWINNCVGERNQKYFLQFLLYVGVMSAYAVLLVAGSWIGECEKCSHEIEIRQKRIMHCIILSLISVLFGMFVLTILVDQIQSLDEAEINLKSRKSVLQKIFGKRHPVLWLLPCSGGNKGLYLAHNYDV